MITQPAYPFYTRFGTGHFNAWLSETALCEVRNPESWFPEAAIEWTRQKFVKRLPDFSKGNSGDVLITRDEFMAAYKAADEFLQAAAREFLPATAVELASKEQKDEITRLLNHPAFDKRVRSKLLLKANRMTRHEAAAAIKALTDTRTMFDQLDAPVGQYAAVAEVFHINTAA